MFRVHKIEWNLWHFLHSTLLYNELGTTCIYKEGMLERLIPSHMTVLVQSVCSPLLPHYWKPNSPLNIVCIATQGIRTQQLMHFHGVVSLSSIPLLYRPPKCPPRSWHLRQSCSWTSSSIGLHHAGMPCSGYFVWGIIRSTSRPYASTRNHYFPYAHTTAYLPSLSLHMQLACLLSS